MAERLLEALQNLDPWLVVSILAATPISEVRGSIPVGMMVYKLPFLEILFLSVFFASLAVVWVVPLYKWMSLTFRDMPVIGRIFRWFISKAEKHRHKVDKYGMVAVTLFIAVPLPGSGCWSGSLLAAVSGMKPLQSMICVVIGNFLASCIVAIAVYSGVEIFNAIHVPAG